MEAPTPLMTAADVAAYLRMTRQGLWKLRRRDPSFPTPATLSPTSPRWRLADVDGWLESTRAACNERSPGTADGEAGAPDAGCARPTDRAFRMNDSRRNTENRHG